MSTNLSDQPGDGPVARRLSKLRTMPVDTASLDRKLRAVIPQPAAQKRPAAMRVLTPLRALAASVVLAAGVAIAFFAASPSPVLASPEKLASIYTAAVQGNDTTTPVRTIDDARAALQRLWPGTPEMPELPEHQLMSCCVHRIGRQMLSCMTFELDGEPVTLAVASAESIHVPRSANQADGDAGVLVSESAGVRMAMTERDGIWMCLMGKLPAPRLRETVLAIRDSRKID